MDQIVAYAVVMSSVLQPGRLPVLDKARMRHGRCLTCYDARDFR